MKRWQEMVTTLQKLIIFNQNISGQNKNLLFNTATLNKLVQKPPVWQRTSEQGALYNQLTTNGQPLHHIEKSTKIRGGTEHNNSWRLRHLPEHSRGARTSNREKQRWEHEGPLSSTLSRWHSYTDSLEDSRGPRRWRQCRIKCLLFPPLLYVQYPPVKKTVKEFFCQWNHWQNCHRQICKIWNSQALIY